MARVHSPAVRLLTWNLNARRQIEGQVAATASRSPDVVALQEVTRRSAPLLRLALPAAGLPHVVDSFAGSPPWTAVGPRRYGLLIASRFPLEPATHARGRVAGAAPVGAGDDAAQRASNSHDAHPPRQQQRGHEDRDAGGRVGCHRRVAREAANSLRRLQPAASGDSTGTDRDLGRTGEGGRGTAVTFAPPGR